MTYFLINYLGIYLTRDFPLCSFLLRFQVFDKQIDECSKTEIKNTIHLSTFSTAATEPQIYRIKRLPRSKVALNFDKPPDNQDVENK